MDNIWETGKGRDAPDTGSARENESSLVIGRNAVYEALKAGRTVEKLYVLDGKREASLQRVVALAREKGVVIVVCDKRRLDFMTRGAHQGVVAVCAVKEYSSLEDILAYAASRGECPFIIICDEINDPHNLGALIRSANAAGAHGLIVPKRHSAGLNETVAKASAGAVEYLRIARVSNLVRTAEELKKAGIWIFGADMDGKQAYFEADLTGPAAIVIGSEGDGIGRLLKEKCDFTVNIPMAENAQSLNASVAGGILMYEVVRQRTLAARQP